jgi:hypothetical protein
MTIQSELRSIDTRLQEHYRKTKSWRARDASAKIGEAIDILENTKSNQHFQSHKSCTHPNNSKERSACRARRRGQTPAKPRTHRIPRGPLIPHIERWIEASHLSESTGRLYLNHALRWAEWCETNKVDPFNASPDDFSDWASFVTGGNEAAPDTIKSRMGSIRSLYTFLQNSNVTATYPI